jgi:dATP pyrophosphohydrolase
VRAPFQILVLPFRKNEIGKIEFVIFKRSDENYWQGIAGGGEDDETPIEAAKRELFEETGITNQSKLIPLQFKAYVPVSEFEAHKYWPKDLFAIPEHYFALECENENIKLSHEHNAYKWVDFEIAYKLLHWQSNKNGLWELNERLKCLNLDSLD